MKVKEIMTSNPVCCTPATRLQEVARMMADCDCGQIPVVESLNSRKPVGVLTDRDIVCRTVAEGKNPLDLTARDVMSTPVVTVTPETSLDACCRVMEDEQVRRAPVVDDRGWCCGIVSQADIARSAPQKTTADMVKTVSQRVNAGRDSTMV